MNIYLGLGSNLGERRANLAQALTALDRNGVRVRRVSPVVESPALLPDDAPADWNRPYLNVVAECATESAPETVLDRAKAIEHELGRRPSGRWSPRPIDIDLLLWGTQEIATERLTLPHPGITERAFVLSPLAALAPRLVIPGRGARTVLEWSRAAERHIPLWMGIVNITPDSFSDGGELVGPGSVQTRVAALFADGAELIDVGAESTRPGATTLTAASEWARLEPVLGPLLDRYRGMPLRPRFSVDTYHPENARRAVELGVDIINDVSGLTQPAMIGVAADSGAEFVAMHNLGVPADRAKVLPVDRDPGDEVERWLAERVVEWQRAGIDLERVVFDPGIGFGKNPLQSLRLLRDLRRFDAYGLRMLVGHSRKSFMHQVVSSDRAARDLFTIGASLKLCAQGVDIVRVHDVAGHVAAYRGWAHLG
jgi:dihydropteroate synthase/2-amino-4-hydroxy-6-hydroxymethyldihydropteridine diphosphokinase